MLFVSDADRADVLHWDLRMHEEMEYDMDDDNLEPWKWPLRLALVKDDVAKLDFLVARFGEHIVHAEYPESAPCIQEAARFGAEKVVVRLCGEHGACEIEADNGDRPGVFCTTQWTEMPVGHICHSLRCYEGDTPLMEAVRSGQVRTVRRLLDIGANIDQMNRWGQTALSELFFNLRMDGPSPTPPKPGADLTMDDCRLAIVCLLLSRGASLEHHYRPNSYGPVVSTNVAAAIEHDNAAMAEYMRSERRFEYPGVSGRLDIPARQSLVVAWALLQAQDPSHGLGSLPREVVQGIAGFLPPLPEPSQEEVNELNRRNAPTEPNGSEEEDEEEEEEEEEEAE